MKLMELKTKVQEGLNKGYEEVKKYLFIRATGHLVDMYEDAVFEKKEDMYGIVQIKLPSWEYGIIFKKSFLDIYKVSEEQVLADAKANLNYFDLIVMPLDGMVEHMGFDPMELEGIPPQHMMICVTRERGYGAGVLFYENGLPEIAKRIGKDSFYIIPSSIHELLLMPDVNIPEEKRAMWPYGIAEIIRDVNAEVVPPEEVLSNRLFHYDPKNGFRRVG